MKYWSTERFWLPHWSIDHLTEILKHYRNRSICSWTLFYYDCTGDRNVSFIVRLKIISDIQTALTGAECSSRVTVYVYVSPKRVLGHSCVGCFDSHPHGAATEPVCTSRGIGVYRKMFLCLFKGLGWLFFFFNLNGITGGLMTSQLQKCLMTCYPVLT